MPHGHTIETDHDAYAAASLAPTARPVSVAPWSNRWLRWDFASGKEIASVNAPTEPAEKIAFSPDGKYVATQDFYTLHVWDRATGKHLHHMRRSPGEPAVLFTPDGKGSCLDSVETRALLLLEMATWKQTKREFETPRNVGKQFSAGPGPFLCRLSPDGKVLATPIPYGTGPAGSSSASSKPRTESSRRLNPSRFLRTASNSLALLLGMPIGRSAFTSGTSRIGNL